MSIDSNWCHQNHLYVGGSNIYKVENAKKETESSSVESLRRCICCRGDSSGDDSTYCSVPGGEQKAEEGRVELYR
jgi:hypothetical protein